MSDWGGPLWLLIDRIIWVYLSAGIWVYPLLKYFNTVGLLGFFLLNMTVVTQLYVIGEKLNTKIWGKRHYYDLVFLKALNIVANMQYIQRSLIHDYLFLFPCSFKVRTLNRW